MAKILILGAGVVGAATAWFLKANGHEVAVLDRAASAGEGTSFANGAQLSYSKTYPLSNPKTIRSIPRLLLSSESPIHIKKIDLEFIKWGLKFLGQSTKTKASANAVAVLQIALRSRELMHLLTQRYEVNFDYARTGKIFMFTNLKDFDAAKSLANDYDHMGITQNILTPSAAILLEPALQHMEKSIKGVIYSEIDETGDAKKFSTEIVRLAAEAGVNFLFNQTIDDIKYENGRIISVAGYEADIFVNCLGVSSNSLLEKCGIKLPIYPMKGYSITMPATKLAPKISITDEGRKIVYSEIGGRLRVAGIAEFAGYDLSIDKKIIEKMRSTAQNCFPHSADYSNPVPWAGLRPMTPSTVPIIGKSEEFGNLYFNTGHGMLGWTLALGSAEKLAGIIG